ncbi:OVARIAN TUMOR DOMAIN-containing deubiquitinating enzyme 9-like isoform X2 [Salvia hispanica]|uniref:OVARIAN TUMOR DOMAIN-containing deubiquitinating enzyme 9-like isoform X2 n=1 Tax=Salvia hispanica TaxID=49212 RepID=UPI00200966DF|nr:OVARIAN TUMOR DOMAIN-containing deubiquitinating enzyme 9-like isoform X2 [Salvia hispanica]
MGMVCDPDPDVVRWGLHHLFDVSSLAKNHSPPAVTCYVEDMSATYTLKEEFCNTAESVVENDKAIAQALQDEFIRLDTANDQGSVSSREEQHQNESILSQNWPFSSGREKAESAGSAFYSVIDGEMEKRLNQLVPIPHVPKINGEIPSVDEATSDHQRLLNRLQMYDLVELKILGDGNCQFRSLSDQIYRASDHHKFVRDQVVNQLKLRRDLYENFVPMPYGDYIKKMSKNGEWGDHLTLQAAADWLGIKIFVVTSYKDTCYIEILPQTEQKSDRTIFLSFWAEVHYNSIYPLGEWLETLPEIENDSAIDGELGKRLNQLVPIPHVPKTNGEIPSVDEATSDHQRLLNRLKLYDLVELKILGDGNCQFRSLSDQIYRASDHHKFVREQVVNQLKLRRDLYENFVPMAYGDYIKKMSKNGEWGDHLTLQAAADWFGIKLFVVTSYKDTCYIEILPQTEQKSDRTLFLSFWAEVHYNSIYPLGELPEEESKKKKKRRWW